MKIGCPKHALSSLKYPTTYLKVGQLVSITAFKVVVVIIRNQDGHAFQHMLNIFLLGLICKKANDHNTGLFSTKIGRSLTLKRECLYSVHFE